MKRLFTISLVLLMLPVPPLDGFGIVTQIFNLQKYDWYWKVYQNGFAILMLLIVFMITTPLMENGIVKTTPNKG